MSSTTTMGETSPIPASAEPHQGRNHQHHRPTPSVTPHAPAHQSQSQTQSQSQQTELVEEEEEEWLVACRCENGKALLTLLSCLQHVSAGHQASDAQTTQKSSSRRNNSKKHTQIQPVTVFCSPSRFTFHVFGPAKQSEASVELQKAMFTQYQVLNNNNNNNNSEGGEEEDWQAGGEFCVNLTTVLESLQLLGSLEKTKVLIMYNLQTEIFKLELLQDDTDVVCTAAIPGLMTPEDAADGNSLSNAFRSDPLAVRMMVHSGILRELLPEWSNVNGASCVTIAVSQAKGLEIAVLGNYGECWVQVPPTGDHLVSPLELADPHKTVTRTYPLHSMLSSMKGLEIAEETCININQYGIMAIQHKTMDPTGNGCSNFVDFIMTCLEDEEEEDSNSQEDDDDEESTTQASQSTFRTLDRQTVQTEQSPVTTTTKRNARRRQPKKLPKQKFPVQEEYEDNSIPVDGSDMEEDEDTPRSRQKRQSRLQKKQPAVMAAMEEDEDSSSSEEDEDGNPAPISMVGPLFGSVVREPTATSSTTPPRRQRRRRRWSQQQPSPEDANAAKQNKRKVSRKDGNESDASRDLLADSSSEEENNNSSEDEEDLDITALALSPTRGQRSSLAGDGECSSPEIVYGRQEM